MIEVEGKTYWGSATTTENIQHLIGDDKQTGKCTSGAYYWQTNTIILKDFTIECLTFALEDIISENALDSIFYLIPDSD